MNRIPCTKCEKTCLNAHGLKVHMGRAHKKKEEEEEYDNNDESLIDSDVGSDVGSDVESDIEAKNKYNI
jgi:hypothetical protein